MPKKKYNNLFEQIIDEKNVEDAYRKTQLGQMKYKRGAIRFSQDLTVNLNALRDSVLYSYYRPKGYHAFSVYEPKERLIYAPAFEDKVVQHMINNVLKDVYRPCFVYDSYSCIECKGTHACVERISHFMRLAKRNYGTDAHIVKADIAKFFYSMDREILKDLFRQKITCLDTLHLLDVVVDSSPGDVGLPLGNLTSQLFANIYLNKLDQFCKRVLSIKYYVRYADDIVLIVEDKKRAKYILNEMRRYVQNNLHLKLHPKKSKIFPLEQGVNCVGFKIYSTHRLLRNDCKKKIKRKIRKMPNLIDEGKLTIEKANQMLGSWCGHAKNGCSYNFKQQLTKKFDYVYKKKMKNKNEILKIKKIRRR